MKGFGLMPEPILTLGNMPQGGEKGSYVFIASGIPIWPAEETVCICTNHVIWWRVSSMWFYFTI